jgi:hypothetical protein
LIGFGGGRVCHGGQDDTGIADAVVTDTVVYNHHRHSRHRCRLPVGRFKVGCWTGPGDRVITDLDVVTSLARSSLRVFA